MNREEIEETEWAQRFKRECPTEYTQAISLAERLDRVVIEKRDDHSFKGDFLWAITPEIDPEFWLDAAKTKKAALSICDAMRWEVACPSQAQFITRMRGKPRPNDLVA